MRVILFLLLIAGVGIGAVIGLNSNQDKNILPTISTPAPTPFEFQEMTIPYLRSYKFESSLADLRQVSNNANYTSYTTSYTSEGLKVNGLLTRPKGEMSDGGWPAIVFVHGYILPAQYRTTQNYMSYVDYLARNGFVVLKIDLRGHDQSEGEAGGSYYSSDYVMDTLHAHAALALSDFVNKDKIGLWGHSMAGNVVLRSQAAKPEIPAVAIWAGAGFTYSDIQQFGIDDNSYRPPPQNTERARKRARLRELYGDFDPESTFWKQVTPANYLNEIKGAIGLFHAVDDNVVNIEYSRNLDSLLDQTAVEHELNEYSSGGHNLSGSTFTRAMQATVEFYKKYLN